jgi:hypothetical protein
VVAAAVVEVLVVVGAVVVVAPVTEEAEVVVPVLVPDPIAVVMGPLSMYTPLTYQSSIPAWFTMRRTPTWKSAEFYMVNAD